MNRASLTARVIATANGVDAGARIRSCAPHEDECGDHDQRDRDCHEHDDLGGHQHPEQQSGNPAANRGRQRQPFIIE
jgi:hypothetical protein